MLIFSYGKFSTFPIEWCDFFVCFFLSFTGNGYITTAVLREILKELDDKITNEDLDMMIEEIDSDGSGTVDFDGNINCTHFFHSLVSLLLLVSFWH